MLKFSPRTNYSICGFQCPGLGDLWATICYAINNPKVNKITSWCGRPDGNELLPLILDSLNSIKKLEIVNEAPTFVPNMALCYGQEYVRTKVQWKGGKARKLCYQLDGISNARNKNLGKDQEKRLLDHLNQSFNTINVGNKLPVPQIIDHLSESHGLVCIPSGISHIAISVGAPVFVILTEGLMSDATKFPFFLNSSYGNKRNMVFYHNLEPFLAHKTFTEDLRKFEMTIVNTDHFLNFPYHL